MTAYTIAIEGESPSYSAYVLDFDGCVATGSTIEEVKENMAAAIASHLELMAEAGEAAPAPLVVGTATVAV